MFSLGEGNLIFVVRAVGKIISGRSVAKIIIIILSFGVVTSKNQNIDHRVKETCAITSTQVTYETYHIYLFRVKCTKFLFSYVLYYNLKEKDHVRRNIISKTINICM